LSQILIDITAQSAIQLHKRQTRNQDAGFTPENIVPRYFKTFYGDVVAMKKD